MSQTQENTPQQNNDDSQNNNGAVNVEETLVKEFEQMFIRENLSKNIYLLNRMNNNLEIPLEIIYNERKIKSISQDTQQVLNALKATSNVEVLQDKNVIKPKIQLVQNKIIINNIEESEQQKFQSFLNENLQEVQKEVVFDRYKCCRIILKTEEEAKTFLEWVNQQTFNGKKIEAYYEPENIYISLLQSANTESKNFNPYGGYNQFYGGMNPYMGYYYVAYPQVQSANNFYIRRAKQDESSSDKQSSYDRNYQKSGGYSPYYGGYGSNYSMSQEEQMAAYYQYQQQLYYYQQQMYYGAMQQQPNQPQNQNQRNNRSNHNNNNNQQQGGYRKKSQQRSSSAKKHGKRQKSKNKNYKGDDKKEYSRKNNNTRREKGQDQPQSQQQQSYQQNKATQQVNQDQQKSQKSKKINIIDDEDVEQQQQQQNDKRVQSTEQQQTEQQQQQRPRINSKEFMDIQKNAENKTRQKSSDKRPRLSSRDFVAKKSGDDEFPELSRNKVDSKVNPINSGNISKKQIVEAFKDLLKNDKIKINERLLQLDDNKIPVLEKLAEPRLEYIEPSKVTIRKDSLMSSARQTPRSTPGYQAQIIRNSQVDLLEKCL